MNYATLVWAALRRAPLQVTLTLLSVVTAFTLFGLMAGLSASFDRLGALAHADRVFVNPRFGTSLPKALASKLMSMNEIKEVSFQNFLNGYYRNKRNSVNVVMVGDGFPKVATELSEASDFRALQSAKTGVILSRIKAQQLDRKVGDTFSIISNVARFDGSKIWTFKVVQITDELPSWSLGYMFGNYSYFDDSLPHVDQGTVANFVMSVKDPEKSDALAMRIDRLFANSATPTQSFSQKAAYERYMQSGPNIGAATKLIAAAGSFMILFLVANMITQSVRERTSEFAVMKAIGFSDTSLASIVFAEAMISCVTGCALGLVLASILASYFPTLIPPAWGVPRPVMSIAVIVTALLVSVCIAVIGVTGPIIRLRRLKVTAAISGK